MFHKNKRLLAPCHSHDSRGKVALFSELMLLLQTLATVTLTQNKGTATSSNSLCTYTIFFKRNFILSKT